jgi:hypothetical protein
MGAGTGNPDAVKARYEMLKKVNAGMPLAGQNPDVLNTLAEAKKVKEEQ